MHDRGGGLERYQHAICEHLSNSGINVAAWVQSAVDVGPQRYPVTSYASPSDSRRNKLQRLGALASRELPRNELLFVSHHASVAVRILRYLREVPHVVHFQGPWADEARFEGAPLWKTLLQKRAEKCTYSRADLIITLSNAFKDLVVARYKVKPERVMVVPAGINCVDADIPMTKLQARESLGWPQDRPIILAVRRLVKRVGLDVLLQSIHMLVSGNSKLSDVLVLIGGSGPMEKELKSQIEFLGLKRHVRLLGFIPEQSLRAAYKAADFTIVPTQCLEGFGLVTLESLAVGTPCIVTPVGSLPEVLGGFCPDLITQSSEPAQITESLRMILSGVLHIPSSAECQFYVRQKYDWSIIGPKVLSAYELAFKSRS